MSTLTAGEVKVEAAQREGVQSQRAARIDALAVGGACLLFLCLTLYQINLPGLYPDEAFDVIPAMQLLLGHKVELLDNAGLHLFGLDFPVMSSSAYQGVTSTYLALPFFAVGGINVFSLRLMTVTTGLVAVVLTYFLARAWFGRVEARLAAVMLAVSPAWVFWSRLGVYVVSEVVPIAAGALLAFTLWGRRRPFAERNGSLYLGAFLLGLGLTTKLLFLWFITSLAVCAVVFFGQRVWQHRDEVGAQAGKLACVSLVVLAAFCAGAAPFIIYNLQTRGTYYLLKGSASLGPTTHGVDNRAFMRNLWTEVDAFRVLLDGGYFWFQGILSRTFSNPL
ncbi:MAG TPA: glycosyltransferase family 39 protein, partial [Chloroflexia bacterium]|nr:glycosyltransferase family 39 protein [Chloroflexia bacterium]